MSATFTSCERANLASAQLSSLPLARRDCASCQRTGPYLLWRAVLVIGLSHRPTARATCVVDREARRVTRLRSRV